MSSQDRGLNIEQVILLLKTHPNHRALFTFLRAYAFGYALTVVPRMVKYWYVIIAKYIARRKRPDRPQTISVLNLVGLLLHVSIERVLWKTLHARGFPMMCGIGLGGGQLLEEIVLEHKENYLQKKIVIASSSVSSPSSPITSEVAVIDAIVPPMMSQREKVATTFVTATLASSFSLYYLHRISPGTVNKTIDLTLLALVRAIDVLVRYIYQERISERTKQKWIPKWVSEHIDTLAFVCSCSEIMFAWFYAPKRLPSSYIDWINHMAQIEPQFVETLRLVRKGEIQYGRDTGHPGILSEYAEEVGLDPGLGDPANGQIPCIVVHGNETRSCEIHAGRRWFQGFLTALKIYLPIHGLPPLVFRTSEVMQKPMDSITHIITSTSQSASFLATFITAIWYSCCFTRSRIGPTLLPWVDKTHWDRLGPLLGCFVCGFSLMLENKRRRSEMALYVAPRALFSFWGRLVGENEWWSEAETLKELGEVGLFGFAMGVVVTAMKYRKGIVRPMVRGALSWVLDV